MLVATASLTAAQVPPTVSDTDITRAAQQQPVITQRQIDHARQRHRMPSAQELARVPTPAAPNLDALPSPQSSRAIDLQALARGVEAHADALTAAQQLRAAPALLVFVSLSMPPATLQRLLEQAAQAGGVLVVRGLVNGSLRDTVARMQALIGERQAGFQIDPQAFDRFAIGHTPTFVLLRPQAQAQPCGAGHCVASENYVAVAGDVSLEYALEHILRRAPAFGSTARSLLNKLRRQ